MIGRKNKSRIMMKAIRMYWRQFIVVMLVAMPSCSNPDMISETESSGSQAKRLTVLRACPPVDEKSKTVLVDGGEVAWVPGDRIKVFKLYGAEYRKFADDGLCRYDRPC